MKRTRKNPTKRLTGFALMSKKRRQEIASLGGSTSQGNGTAHTFTSAEAKRYGRRGAKKRWHGEDA